MKISTKHPHDSFIISQEQKGSISIPQKLQITSMQGVIFDMNKKIADTIAERKVKRSEFLENQSKYFELGGYLLERQNHGAPSCPAILLNEAKASHITPQAWLRVISGVEHWYYNYPGALAEAGFLGKEIPTIDAWTEMLESIPGNVEEKAQVLNISLEGCRDSRDNEFYGDGDCSILVTSSPDNHGDVQCVHFDRHSRILTDAYDYGHGVHLRFFAVIK